MEYQLQIFVVTLGSFKAPGFHPSKLIDSGKIASTNICPGAGASARLLGPGPAVVGAGAFVAEGLRLCPEEAT